MVPAKDSPNVKLENFLTILECQSWGKLCVPCFLGAFGFYSDVEPTFLSCVGSLFLMEKIIINGRISRDPSHVRILVILRLYRLGLIVRHKLFPFRITWRSLKSCRSHVAIEIRPPCACEPRIRPPLKSIYYQFIDLISSGSFGRIHHPNLILFSCPLTPWIRHLIWTDPWSDNTRFVFREVCIK